MMGYQTAPPEKLVCTPISLEQRVRGNPVLRRIARVIDFDFVYAEVADKYGARGNVSIPPPVIVKRMLLLVLYNVRSERELMETIPERLDWLWFLGYDLDADIPHHSVLSKARKRWGIAVFPSFFERIVWQCVEAGLVDGRKIFVAASLVEANAANRSIVDTHSLRRDLNARSKQLEERLADVGEALPEEAGFGKVNDRYLSTTDPEAAIVRRGKSKLYYEVHRAVDGRSEIITATEVTAGDVNEAHRLLPVVDGHHRNPGRCAATVVADSKSGTAENFLACHDRGLRAHIPDLGEVAAKRSAKRKIFAETSFPYDPATDTYCWPAGQLLKPKSLHANRHSLDYAAPKRVCAGCQLREHCTQNKTGRTIKRHLRQETLDTLRQRSRCVAAKRDIRTRQHLMERSFARAKRYGFDRARWRGLWRMRIQAYLICALQNIAVLLRYGGAPPHKATKRVQPEVRAREQIPDPLSGRRSAAFSTPYRTCLPLGAPRLGCAGSSFNKGQRSPHSRDFRRFCLLEENALCFCHPRIYLGNSPARSDNHLEGSSAGQ